MKQFKYLVVALLLLSLCIEASAQIESSNEVRPKTPIMGWASWNNYRVEINEDETFARKNIKIKPYNLVYIRVLITIFAL